MKTKMLLLALVVLGTNLVFSQTTNQENKTEDNKKVLKKIKRQMNLVNFNDYIPEGTKANVILHCQINKDKEVELAKIEGSNKDLNDAIKERFENRPIKVENERSDSAFSLMITFKHFTS